MSNHNYITGYNDTRLERYIEDHTLPEDPVLHDLRRQTHLRVLRPRMVSGPVQGQLLTMLCRMVNPRSVLEIGTFTGYSAICMAKGMSVQAHLHTIEREDELESFIREYLKKSGQKEKITLHIGNALEVIKELDETFDLVFIDGDKREYPDYYRAIVPRMRAGGYILADNILWSGKVVEPVDPRDEYTKGIIEFNKMVSEDERTEQVILPVRDGLMMIRVND